MKNILTVEKKFLENIHILYVEDEKEIADEMFDILECYFPNIYKAYDGFEALNIFRSKKIDIILTDIQMPKLDGLEMSKKIKEISPDIPIIVCSAFNEPEYLKRSIDIGVSQFVLKPVDFVLLMQAFDKVLLDLYRKKELELKHKEIEEQKNKAMAANEAKSVFLANMSHEIRTPLNAINGFINIISEEFHDKKLNSYIKVVEKNSELLLSIINDILDFNKIESGKMEITKELFYLKEEIKNISDLYRVKASEKNIDYRLHIDQDIPNICNNDSLRLKQILSNLLSNALKFTHNGGTVSLSITSDKKNKKINYRIKDTGIGIDKKYQSKIFEPFCQEDEGTTKKYGGTGLGLAICSKLVSLLGGKLKLMSQKDQGSEFYFSLHSDFISGDKIKQEDDNDQITDKKDNLKGAHLLLVEDNESNQMFMKIILKKMGLDFDIANDGVEAVEKFKQSSYDAVLMDENMPNMNGIEATKQILEYERQNSLIHTPIIALTANALKGDRDRFLKSGMDEYLTKPLKSKDLQKVLHDMLGVIR